SACRWQARSVTAPGLLSSTISSSSASSTDGPDSLLLSEISKAHFTATPSATKKRKAGSHPSPSRSGATSRPDGFANAPRKIAKPPKRQGQIVFAQDFPPIRPLAGDRRLAWHIPAIVFIAPDDAVAGGGQVSMLREIGDVILEQDQLWPPSFDIE